MRRNALLIMFVLFVLFASGCESHSNQEDGNLEYQTLVNSEGYDITLVKNLDYSDDIHVGKVTVIATDGVLYYFDTHELYNQYSIIDHNNSYTYSLKYAIRYGALSLEELLTFEIPELQSVNNDLVIDDTNYFYTYISEEFRIFKIICQGTCFSTCDITSFTQDGKSFGGLSSTFKGHYYYERNGEIMSLQDALDLHLISIDMLDYYGIYDALDSKYTEVIPAIKLK